jgi:hypothetical protein
MDMMDEPCKADDADEVDDGKESCTWRKHCAAATKQFQSSRTLTLLMPGNVKCINKSSIQLWNIFLKLS